MNNLKKPITLNSRIAVVALSVMLISSLSAAGAQAQHPATYPPTPHGVGNPIPVPMPSIEAKGAVTLSFVEAPPVRDQVEFRDFRLPKPNLMFRKLLSEGDVARATEKVSKRELIENCVDSTKAKPGESTRYVEQSRKPYSADIGSVVRNDRVTVQLTDPSGDTRTLLGRFRVLSNSSEFFTPPVELLTVGTYILNSNVDRVKGADRIVTLIIKITEPDREDDTADQRRCNRKT
jgi:hypothetical protein